MVLQVGVFGRAVHMTELELLLKRRYRNLTRTSCERMNCGNDTMCPRYLDINCISCLIRDKDYWRQRLREERTEMVKQSKEYWDSQAMLSMGI